MTTYKTSQIAKMFDLHPNTIRLYEEIGFLPLAIRQNNGYRVFEQYHVEQLKIIRLALKIEILQNGLRKQAIEIIKASAKGNIDQALLLTNQYIQDVEQEEQNVIEALSIVADIINGVPSSNIQPLKRKEVSILLDISMDTIRNWELNGLLQIKRKTNGYRVYNGDDIQRLKIIRSLRCANYSLSAILRMLHALSKNPMTSIKEAIDTPHEDEDVISACDQLSTSLKHAKDNSKKIQEILYYLKANKINPPL